MLTEATTVDQCTALENGTVLVRTRTQILRDGEVVSTSYHRASLEPGADIKNEAAQVQAICKAVWTPEVLAAYRAAMETANAALATAPASPAAEAETQSSR